MLLNIIQYSYRQNILESNFPLGLRIDPYHTPADALKGSGSVITRQQKSSSPVQIRDRVSSGIYSEVSDSLKMPPPPHGEEEGKAHMERGDSPYEEVNYDNVSLTMLQL